MQHQQEREENLDQNVSEDNSKNTYRIVFTIIIVMLISMALFILITPPEHMYIKMLRFVSIKQLIIANIIPIILIIRNDNISSYFKSQISKILKSCWCKNNQIEPIIELNVL